VNLRFEVSGPVRARTRRKRFDYCPANATTAAIG
jgi:hypothetical protein